MYILASFVKDRVFIGARVYLWACHTVPLICISVFFFCVPALYCLDYYSFVVQSEVRELNSSSSVFFFFFLLKITLALWGLLCFQTNCKNFCSSSVKNAMGILTGIALNLQIALGTIVIFTILIPTFQEHSLSVHVIFDFFHQCLTVFFILVFCLLR